ncbi:MAG TPA: hypothetical protein VGV89_01535 [Thermoplasmata archaeon]|nr:hypothetical protein [Thermoplasmata archaeon]
MTLRICGPCGSELAEDGSCPRRPEHRIFIVEFEIHGEREVEAIDETTAEEGLTECYSINELVSAEPWDLNTRLKESR